MSAQPIESIDGISEDQCRMRPKNGITAFKSPHNDDITKNNTLKRQLGRAWRDLHPNIRERFDREPEDGERVVYEGAMQEIRRSFMGRLFAECTRVVGNPLTPYAGRDVPMRVELFKKPGRNGVFWRRTYFYASRKPYTVTSVKRESRAGEMLECVGGGFGMKLRVYAENGALHFKSHRYFWRVFGAMIPLPHWITPGETHVVHTDLGGGAFRFTISMTHGVLGETFYQTGVFRRKGG